MLSGRKFAPRPAEMCYQNIGRRQSRAISPSGNTMIRTRSTTVSFSAPFTLPGLGRDYPAGSYRVDVDEEQLEVSFEAFRRVATTIMLASGATTEAWPVDPLDLTAALDADAARKLGLPAGAPKRS
jgi:hypothetical protein